MKNYYSRHAAFMFLFGGLFLTLGLVLFLLQGDLSLAGPSVMLIVTGCWMRSVPVVRLGHDRIEVQPAPMRSKKIVAIDSIESVDTSHPKRISLGTADGTVVIPTSALPTRARAELLHALRHAG